MKLLFILPEYVREPVGGIRTFYCDLLPALARSGCLVKVLLARREFAGAESFTDEVGVEVEYVRADLLQKHDAIFQDSQFAGNWLLGQFMPVASAAFEQTSGGVGFDLVELTDWPLIFLPWVAQAEAFTPYTISLHSSVGQMVEYEPLGENRLDYTLVRLFEASGFAAAPSLHANSNLNARYWERITNRKVDVLLPYLANRTFTRDGRSVFSELERVSSAKPRGAVFARFQNLKGAWILASALMEVPNVEVHWYGADMFNLEKGCLWSESLKGDYPNLMGDKLIYHKPLRPDDVQEHMAKADFVCVPSLWDVFNLSAIEAMSQGCVVICSQQAGAEMLIENEVNGFTFDAQKPSDLADKIRQAISLTSSEKSKMGNAARLTIQDRLNPKTILEERLRYYKQTADNHRPRNNNPFLPEILSLKRTRKMTPGRLFYKARKALGF